MFNAVFGRVMHPVFGPLLEVVSAVTLILEQFTDADATSLDAHTIAPTNTPVTSWTEVAGDWKIVGNVTCLNAAQSNARATCNPNVADCVLSADVKSGASGTDSGGNNAGLLARVTSALNYFKFCINAYDDIFKLLEYASGSPTQRASASVTLANTTAYPMEVTLSGTSLIGTLSGANTLNYTSSANQTAKVHGIAARNTADSIDNFQVIG